MTGELRLTQAAKQDLADIWVEIIEARDERSADRMTRRILDICRMKAEFPETGQSREDIAPGIRSASNRPYVIFFRPEEESILVLRILHGRRDVRTILQE